MRFWNFFKQSRSLSLEDEDSRATKSDAMEYAVSFLSPRMQYAIQEKSLKKTQNGYVVF